MKQSKQTKRTLVLSVLSVVLCLAMLVGTTFAWFTDTASASVKDIKSGKLDVQIVDAKTDTEVANLAFVNVDGSDNILWEPGVTFKTAAFKIKSAGTLALKYKLTLDGATGDTMLLDVVHLSVVDEAGNAVALENFVSNLTPAQPLSEAYYIQGTMDTTAGNNYQEKALSGLKLSVYATQDTVESDSNGNMYDKDAEYLVVDAADLKETLANANDNAVISVNGTLTEALTIEKPVTIQNLTTTAPVTIASDGVTLDGAKITSATTALNVGSNVKDVTITNSVISAKTGKTGSHTAVSLPASGKVVFTDNTVSNDYNGLEFGQGKEQALGNGSVISNNTFISIGNNAVSIYRVADGATVTIENNTFTNVSNAIRLSNYTESTSATFIIKGNTVDTQNSWENVFVLLEDVGNNDFTKYTLNFSGNTFNSESAKYFGVYSDAARAFVDNNNPTVSGIN